MWKNLRAKMPQHWHTTRIENRFGGGIPDVHVCAENLAFWLELKTTKTNRVNVSAHQVAWNFAYSQSGGVSFFLVSPLSSPNLYLFAGDQGRGLAEHGLRSGSVGSGTVVPCLWVGLVIVVDGLCLVGGSGSGFFDSLLEIVRGRVGTSAAAEKEEPWPAQGERPARAAT
mgnify:CR=1 FL=1